MKKNNINRNYIWSKLVVNYFESTGLKDVCISPGSRNTPLVLALAENKKIRKHVIVDERSSGFFALGLAKASGLPVAIVTTSGTAVAELYPAIIESYFQKLPLIICTADRPHYLRNSGANQTINQDNIYKNHIRFFSDLGLPQINDKKILQLKNILDKAFDVVYSNEVGPIHFNFPFEKPFEPSNTTDFVDDNTLNKFFRRFEFKHTHNAELNYVSYKNLIKKISSFKNILILSGENSDKKEKIFLMKIAEHLQAPIIAGILSSVRFTSSNFVIKNASSFLRSKSISDSIQPDLILQFGYAPTSNSILDFFAKSSAVKIAINNSNQKYDPSLTTKFLINQSAKEFYSSLIESFPKRIENEYFTKLKNIDDTTERMKHDYLDATKSLFEWNIYRKLLQILPEDSNLMISNSLPIRDFDFIASVNKNIKVFSNRGASGIDGIISSAAGIYRATGKVTYLVIGDLAFFYDINSLLLLKNYKIPLKIILINNNGGGIFELLPVADEKIEFIKYFKTPIHINFEPVVRAFEGKYFLSSSSHSLPKLLKKLSNESSFSVLEIKIDSNITKSLRLNFWTKISNSFSA